MADRGTYLRALDGAEEKLARIVAFAADSAHYAGIVPRSPIARYGRIDAEKLRALRDPAHLDAATLGFATDWLVAGPYPNESWTGHTTAYPPESDTGGIASDWRRYTLHPWDGYVDLLRHFGEGEWVVAYARAWIDADRSVRGELRCGSNDAVAVWIGDRKVHDRFVERGAVPDEDVVPIDIPAGRTPILVKVGQSGADWGFFLRITDADGKPIPGVRIGTGR